MKNYNQKFSVNGIIKSFRNALRGFLILLKFEYNLYIQIGFACVAVLFGIFFNISLTQWAVQTTVIGLVIFAELTNTAFEKTMDLVHPEYSEQVRDIKDLASATVLFMVLVSVLVACFIYLPQIHQLII
jgi:diacylglycerol kinase